MSVFGQSTTRVSCMRQYWYEKVILISFKCIVCFFGFFLSLTLQAASECVFGPSITRASCNNIMRTQSLSVSNVLFFCVFFLSLTLQAASECVLGQSSTCTRASCNMRIRSLSVSNASYIMCCFYITQLRKHKYLSENAIFLQPGRYCLWLTIDPHVDTFASRCMQPCKRRIEGAEHVRCMPACGLTH